jgi:alpha-galactosidase
MSMLTWCAYRAEPEIQWVGLCHSVQGTAHEWCERLGIPLEEVNYVCAGINHLSWFLRFEHKGRDLLPAIREKALDPAVWKSDTTRCEYVKHFGYPSTESSGHNSEYSWWFRKRPGELLPRYCSPKNSPWNSTGFLKLFYKDGRWEEEMEKMVSQPEPLNLTRSAEYGSRIMNARLTGEPVVINGNVPNRGLITNLPQNCMVETPILIDKNGLQPIGVGDLPPQLAALDYANVAVHEMAVEGFFRRDPERIFQAIAYDPLTAAVCSLDEVREMVAEMFEAEAEWLPAEFRGRFERKRQLWKEE